MARSSRRSLAGSATAAARKVISRRSTTKAAAGSEEAAKKAPAKKAPAKAATKTAPTKKAPAKKAPAKKAPAKSATKAAPAKKAPAKKAPATKAPAKKAPATKAPAKKAPAKKAPAKKTVEQSPTKQATKRTSPRSAADKKAVKKTTAVAARSLKVREDESAWTKAELDEVMAELHTHHDKLVVQIAEAEAELAGLMKDAGDGAGQDQADVGASSFERDHEITVVNNERDMVAQIDRALARIEDGTYGQCESCGQPIGKMRVMAFPRATLCLSCKQREERR